MKTIKDEVRRISELFHKNGTHILLDPEVRAFVDKVRTENPEMETSIVSTIMNKGLDAAKAKYDPYSPERIKSNHNAEKRLSAKLAKIEKQGNIQAKYNDFIELIQFLIKNASVLQSVIEFCNQNAALRQFTRGKMYKNVFNQTIQKNISDLDTAIKYQRLLLIETLLLSDTPNRIRKADFFDNDDSKINIRSYIDLKNIDTEPLKFNISFHLIEWGMGEVDSYAMSINQHINKTYSRELITADELMGILKEVAYKLSPEYKKSMQLKVQQRLNEDVDRMLTLMK